METASQLTGIAAADASASLTGVLEGTRICTLDGILPVEYLQPGDRIVARAGLRKLLAVSVLRRRSLDLIRIRASVLGPDRPDEDLLLAPGQCVMIRDWRARILHGREVAAIPAARLEDGEFVIREAHGDVRLFTLRFAEDEVIYAEGLQLACPAFAHEELAR
jgi:hypothetical protein